MGVKDHREAAKGLGPLKGAVITVSDTRSAVEDESGRLIRELLEKEGHRVVAQKIVKNDIQLIRETVQDLLLQAIDFVITTGGTGIGKRDLTIEAVSPLLEKALPGFGELFRALSYAEVGSAAFLSRALLGTAAGKVVVSLPGSPQAVRLALDRLLLPELRHLVWGARG
ncbi:MAG: molybdenum cofactor biosynthesis protein MoaB [candidate division NC10 bacterium]|nr:molybdenum cofactor biosynthesis protein MoaB [candidate division NC10 bacterium]